jgi:hypothetical protein
MDVVCAPPTSKTVPKGAVSGLLVADHTRKSSLSWSPLIESNRRPSPYHLKSSRFSARQGLPAGRRQAVTRILPQPAASAATPAIAPAAGQQPAPVHAQPAATPARACPAAQARPVGLHADQQRPLRRSNDGQTILPIPPVQGTEPALNRHSPIARKNLNQCPYLHLPGSHRWHPGILPSGRTPSNRQEHRIRDPAAGARPPPVRPVMPNSGRCPSA